MSEDKVFIIKSKELPIKIQARLEKGYEGLVELRIKLLKGQTFSDRLFEIKKEESFD